MMKKLFFLLTLFTLAGCGNSATTSNPWDRGAYSAPAAQAPSQLTRDALQSGTGQQPEIYEPLPPAGGRVASGASSGQNPAIGGYGTQAAPQPERFSAAPSLPPVKVALLLPLSGANEDLAQAMLQAAQLALFDMGYDAFELMPRDTRGTPQGAAQAAESVAREGAQLILGPLFAAEVQAAKPVAARYNLNMIAFSTDWTLAGGNTYIMGFLPFGQVERIAGYAGARGLRNVGILAPNTEYGNAVINAFNAASSRSGLGRAKIERFVSGGSDTADVVSRFTNYEARKRAQESQPPGSFKPQLPFDAVLLPVGGEEARSVANMLSLYDLGPSEVKRLGTGLWDDRNLAAEPALAGAWFAAPSPDLRRDFERKYRELYESKAPRLATLAYDATALAAVLAKKSYYETGRVGFDRYAITNPNGFAGIDGIFRFLPDGKVERGLAVLELHRGEIRIVDPAPSTFQSMNY